MSAVPVSFNSLSRDQGFDSETAPDMVKTPGACVFQFSLTRSDPDKVLPRHRRDQLSILSHEISYEEFSGAL